MKEQPERKVVELIIPLVFSAIMMLSVFIYSDWLGMISIVIFFIALLYDIVSLKRKVCLLNILKVVVLIIPLVCYFNGYMGVEQKVTILSALFIVYFILNVYDAFIDTTIRRLK